MHPRVSGLRPDALLLGESDVWKIALGGTCTPGRERDYLVGLKVPANGYYGDQRGK